MYLIEIHNQSLCHSVGFVMIFLVFVQVHYYYLYHKNAILVDNNWNGSWRSCWRWVSWISCPNILQIVYNTDCNCQWSGTNHSWKCWIKLVPIWNLVGHIYLNGPKSCEVAYLNLLFASLKIVSHELTGIEKTCACSFAISKLWGRQSNAWERSTKTAPTTRFLCYAKFQSSIIFIKSDRQLYFFWEAHKDTLNRS